MLKKLLAIGGAYGLYRLWKGQGGDARSLAPRGARKGAARTGASVPRTTAASRGTGTSAPAGSSGVHASPYPRP